MSSYPQEYRPYFVPGYGISRHIIFSHIQYYLGPSATVRPYSYRGREGYLVSGARQALTRVSHPTLHSIPPFKQLVNRIDKRSNHQHAEPHKDPCPF